MSKISYKNLTPGKVYKTWCKEHEPLVLYFIFLKPITDGICIYDLKFKQICWWDSSYFITEDCNYDYLYTIEEI